MPDDATAPRDRMDVTLGVRVPFDLLVEIDNWRAQQRPLPGRPEAVRMLMREALVARANATPAPTRRKK